MPAHMLMLSLNGNGGLGKVGTSGFYYRSPKPKYPRLLQNGTSLMAGHQ